MKKSGWIQISLFLAFIFGLFLVNFLIPDRTFSPIENRMLAQKPEFSWEGLFSGEFMQDFEAYVTDQFAGRDGWTALKAYAEKALGKKENNGVYIAGDTLIERFDEIDEAQLSSNLRAVDRFVGQTEAEVYLMLIPTAAEIWRDRLPAGAPSVDQAAALESVPGRTQAAIADAYSALRNHADEPVYYRTDHHWTSLGACYGADALLRAMGREGVSPRMWTPQTVSTEFYGTLYSSSGARYIDPDSIEIYVPTEGIAVSSFAGGEWTEGALYHMEKLTEKDKYSMFMGGNQPLAVVKTGKEGDKLLLVRDSYADSMVPFLTEAFSEIHLIDLRYFRQDIAGYVRDNGIDCAAVVYSLKNFNDDKNVYFLGTNLSANKQ